MRVSISKIYFLKPNRERLRKMQLYGLRLGIERRRRWTNALSTKLYVIYTERESVLYHNIKAQRSVLKNEAVGQVL